MCIPVDECTSPRYYSTVHLREISIPITPLSGILQHLHPQQKNRIVKVARPSILLLSPACRARGRLIFMEVELHSSINPFKYEPGIFSIAISKCSYRRSTRIFSTPVHIRNLAKDDDVSCIYDAFDASFRSCVAFDAFVTYLRSRGSLR